MLRKCAFPWSSKHTKTFPRAFLNESEDILYITDPNPVNKSTSP